LTVSLVLDQAEAVVNGAKVTLDAPARLVGGSTMVPLRFVAESLGAEVKYDAGPKLVTATLAGKVVRLWIGKTEAEVDGQKRTLTAAPVLLDGRTMVPIRFISEAFGAVVGYDPPSRRVTVDLADTDAVPENAVRLEVGQPFRAALSGANDVDCYYFQTRPGEVYVARTTDLAPGCDTVLALIHEQFTGVILYNDDCTVRSEASELSLFRYGDSAFIYLRVQSARPPGPDGPGRGGNYTIVVERCRENPADLLKSVLVGEVVTGTLESPSEEDWYFFEASEGEWYDIATTDLVRRAPDGTEVPVRTGLYLLAYDAQQLSYVTADFGSGPEGGSEIVWRCEATGYYVLVVNSPSGEYGPYTLKVASGARDAWDRPQDAIRLEPDNDCYVEWLAHSDDSDWFSFQAVRGTRYWIQTFDLAPLCDTLVLLYGPDRQLIALDDDAVGCGSGSRLELVAPVDGTYYVEVTEYGGGLGAYRIAVTTTGPESDGYDETQAVEVVPDGESVAASLVDGDGDWFVFRAQKGLTYTVETGDLRDGCDTYLQLITEDGSVVASSDDIDPASNVASRVEWTAAYSGRVYVFVCQDPSAEGDSTGPYTLRVRSSAKGMGL
ncbi:MAG: hypothetical protein K6U08_07020, partial [Firmicutes bacterium]|nr:hypothetical protein [Bacillota bacterium]